MCQPSRRQVLTLSAAALVMTGCTTDASGANTPASSGQPSPAPATSTAATPAARDWPGLAKQISGTLALPDATEYATVKLTENPRNDSAAPLAVLSAASAEDVSHAVKFAAQSNTPLALRSGGHSYPGYSAGGAPGAGAPPSLVLDVRPLSTVTVNPDSTVTIGAGALLASVYSTLAVSGLAIPGGSCATVGITGLTLGGGVGVLTRQLGLTCDFLNSAEIVTADGSIETASPVSQCHTGSGGQLKRESFSASSHVPYSKLDDAGAAELVTRIQAGHTVPGILECGISLDALGGAMSSVPADATGFAHRAALATVQYTATYADGSDPAPFDAYVGANRAAMVPHWGDSAYVNYANDDVSNPMQAYYISNAQRIAEIRKNVDPGGIFAAPDNRM